MVTQAGKGIKLIAEITEVMNALVIRSFQIILESTILYIYKTSPKTSKEVGGGGLELAIELTIELMIELPTESSIE